MSHDDDDTGDGAQTGSVRLLRCETGQTFTVRFLEHTYGGMFTHYSGRSVRCWGIGQCEGCRKKNRRLWKGYIAVEEYKPATRDWWPAVLELTEHLELQFRHMDLRGQVWRIYRKKPKTKKPTPIEASKIGQLDTTLLREPFDVRIVLQWLYGPGEFRLDDPNPLPPKLYLMPSRDVPLTTDGQLTGRPPEPVHAPPEPAKRKPLVQQFRERQRPDTEPTPGKHEAILPPDMRHLVNGVGDKH